MNELVTAPTTETTLTQQVDTGISGNIMEMATFLSNSTMIPASYQRRPENVFVALEMAQRMGVNVMFVMQNMKVIQGNPAWSGSSIGAMLNCCGKFDDVEVHYVGEREKDNWGAYVSAVSRKTGKELKGATVTLAVAKAEGWYQKAGSKWKTMPELMLSYRAFAWFGRQHAPELMMGLQSTDEIEDVRGGSTVSNPYAKGV